MTSHYKREHLSRNENGRDFVCGDIHGHFSKLKQALVEAGFNARVDRLFMVGDLIDRGPESNQVLEWLDRPWFHSVRGNHEQMAIDWYDGKYRNAENYLANGGAWFLALTREEQQPYADAFRSLPYVMDVQTERGTCVIVHAELPYTTYSDFQHQMVHDPLKNRTLLIDQILWSRRRYDQKDETIVRDVEFVIVGHTPVEEITKLGNHLYIDTGCWRKTLEPRPVVLVQL